MELAARSQADTSLVLSKVIFARPTWSTAAAKEWMRTIGYKTEWRPHKSGKWITFDLEGCADEARGADQRRWPQAPGVTYRLAVR